MPIDHISIDTSKRLGNRLRLAIDQLVDVHSKLKDLKDATDHLTDGTLYTSIETEFGTGSGTGTTLYNLLAGTVAALDAAAVVDFENRLM